MLPVSLMTRWAWTALSVPLYVRGESYGCVCLGWDPEKLRS
jgi:hypothetical protein